MFELTDEFLKDTNVATMPEPMRSTMISNIKKLVQNRVNIKLADDLTDDKVDELERISTSVDNAKWWLGENISKYMDSAEFIQFKKQVYDGDPDQLFAQSKWFQMNVPSFTAILEETLEEVKAELNTIGSPANVSQ
jgi:hypothetical protein